MMKWLIYAYVAFVTLPLISAGSYLNTASPTTQNKNIYKQDPAVGQLPKWAAAHDNVTCIETADGRPEDSETASIRAGCEGPLVLFDTILLDLLAHFNRERVSPRVVHAKGTGAKGYFIVTNDITRYCKASLFAYVGKNSTLKVRFSIGGPSMPGQSDSQREVRGFAISFCTDQGIFNLVGNSIPVFFIEDPIKFPSLTHSQGRNPVTNLKDPNSFWDFATKNPEIISMLLFRFSYYGLPSNFRTMNGHGVNTFKLVNATGSAVYCKFHWTTDQGVQSLTQEESDILAARDPDAATRDLYDAIDHKENPSWTFYIQVMTFEQAKQVEFNPFDATKYWPKEMFPYIEVGKIVLNEHFTNYFAEVENMALCTSRLVPGIEPSPDRLLQARLFAYNDAQRYRLGPNFQQLPANTCSFTKTITNYQVDGLFRRYFAEGAPNYYPNSFNGPVPCASGKLSEFDVNGTVRRYETDTVNFDQAREFWHGLSAKDQNDTITAIIMSGQAANYYIQSKIVELFANVDEAMACQIEAGFEKADTEEPPPAPTEEI